MRTWLKDMPPERRREVGRLGGMAPKEARHSIECPRCGAYEETGTRARHCGSCTAIRRNESAALWQAIRGKHACWIVPPKSRK